MRLFPRKPRPKHLPWKPDGPLFTRQYPDYASYLAHQKSKFSRLKRLAEYDRDFRAALAARLPGVRGARVLCLGARTGAELRAFEDAGARALGVDLRPGGPGVLPADFHRLPFRAGSFDAVYTNSLDHALDLARVAGEARSVTRPGGAFIVEPVAGSDEGEGPGSFECFFWKRIDDLVAALESEGWRTRNRRRFEFPWKGEQVVFDQR